MKIVLYLFLSVFVFSCADSVDRDQEAELVGEYLIDLLLSEKLASTDNVGHPNIVRVGNGLKEKMAEIKSSRIKDCVSANQQDLTEKEASHIIYIVCSKKPVLGVRLKYDKKYKAFHILGYWTGGL
jgi:hypothetical protein